MNLNFTKYHGTGNDFILVDNRDHSFPKEREFIESLCKRHFGIGADGLILLENDVESDFMMVYYNSDGRQSSMCGNGGRCIVHFANALGIISEKTVFKAIDGLHYAEITHGSIRLKMTDVDQVIGRNDKIILDTGSPHLVVMRDELDGIDVKRDGAEIRYSEDFRKEGINVNFVNKIKADTFRVRTYERGVEDETLSCGTGVTAVALAMYYSGRTRSEEITVQTRGGDLRVEFKLNKNKFEEVYLTGPVEVVFKGSL